MMNRRRFIAISAAAAGCSLAWSGVAAAAPTGTVTWRGKALGASASLTIHHHDEARAEGLVRQVVQEVERLEQVFSLYRADSALSQLNRQGALAAPPPDLVALLEAGRTAWEVTAGAFDPTVQPLWLLLAEHFSRAGAAPDGPARDRIAETLELVGFDKVAFDRNRIAFGRRGMALTLNGIAQGYITDRAVDILRRGGIENSLVDMGEIAALGSNADGAPWRIGIEAADRIEPAASVSLVNRAAATSSGGGFAFDAASRFSHLLDPRDGTSARRHRSVTVIAPEATSADAFSTAFALMPRDAIRQVMQSRPELGVYLARRDGSASFL
jgi:thiamine biosynthesis lipoprotein